MNKDNAIFRASQLIRSGQSEPDIWTPKAAHAPAKTEIFCSADDASGAGFVMALAKKHGTGRPWLWVQDRESRKRSGRPYLFGLPDGFRRDCHYIAADNAMDALFSLEEGLRCQALAFVVGELTGDPKALGFTQSRRLAVACETYGVPLYLVRNKATRSLSAARMRWDIEPAASYPLATNHNAPGAPAWNAELFRSRLYRPSRWTLTDDKGELSITAPRDRVDLASLSGDRQMA